MSGTTRHARLQYRVHKYTGYGTPPFASHYQSSTHKNCTAYLSPHLLRPQDTIWIGNNLSLAGKASFVILWCCDPVIEWSSTVRTQSQKLILIWWPTIRSSVELWTANKPSISRSSSALMFILTANNPILGGKSWFLSATIRFQFDAWRQKIVLIANNPTIPSLPA